MTYINKIVFACLPHKCEKNPEEQGITLVLLDRIFLQFDFPIFLDSVQNKVKMDIRVALNFIWYKIR